MKKIQNPSYRIPQRHLTAAGEGLQALARRLEADAAAFSVVNTREGLQRAAELLEQADAVRKSADFFQGL